VRWYACSVIVVCFQGSREISTSHTFLQSQPSRYRYDSDVRSYPCLRMMCHCITTLGHDVCKIIAANVDNMMAGIGIPTAVMDTASEPPSFHRRWSLRSRILITPVDYDRALRCDFLHLSECIHVLVSIRIAICNSPYVHAHEGGTPAGRGSIAYWKLYPIMSRYLGSFYR
jgi:hypothetical protein